MGRFLTGDCCLLGRRETSREGGVPGNDRNDSTQRCTSALIRGLLFFLVSLSLSISVVSLVIRSIASSFSFAPLLFRPLVSSRLVSSHLTCWRFIYFRLTSSRVVSFRFVALFFFFLSIFYIRPYACTSCQDFFN